jgi:hypothetical protein
VVEHVGAPSMALLPGGSHQRRPMTHVRPDNRGMQSGRADIHGAPEFMRRPNCALSPRFKGLPNNGRARSAFMEDKDPNGLRINNNTRF